MVSSLSRSATAAVRLHPDDVLAIAEAVAELLSDRVRRSKEEARLSTAEVAAASGRSPELVRDRAADLVGRKIGGPKAPWQSLDAERQCLKVTKGRRDGPLHAAAAARPFPPIVHAA